MKSHGLWMIIGCALPLLLIFVLPVLGLSGGLLLFIVIILMFGVHLLMIRGHHGNHDKQDEKKEGEHGSH